MHEDQPTTDHVVAVTTVEPSAATAAVRRPPIQGRRWLTTFSSLSNRDFRFLWIGMVALAAGVSMEMVAVGYLVYDLTGSPLILGVVEMGFGIPALALGLPGGVVADRFDRKYVIQLSQSIEVFVALVIAVLILTDQISWTHLALMALIEGSLFSFMMPARQAIIPQLVPKDQFMNAMAINGAAFSTMTLISPAVAGGLYALVGPGGVFLAIMSLKATSVFVTARVRRSPPDRTAERRSVVGDMRDGLVYVWRTPILLPLLVFSLLIVVLSWPFHTLLPVFVVDVYDLGPGAMGLMLSILGAGSLVGSLTIASTGRWRRGQLLAVGAVVTSIGLFLVAAIPIYYAAVAIMLLIGLGEGIWWTLVMALTMDHAEDHYRGRVSAILMMTFGLMPLGVLPAGVAAEYLGAQVAVAIMAGLLTTTSLVFFVTQRQVRSIQ